MKAYKGVIFDFNGTLFFDNDKHVLAWNEISRIIRKKDISEEELHAKFNGTPNEQNIRYMLGENAPDKLVEEYSYLKEELYRNFCEKDTATFHLVAGVYEYFQSLKDRGIPFTIASASIKPNIDFFRKSFRLDIWIEPDSIVYDDGTYENKVKMFLDAADNIGVPIEDTLIIEDSFSGIRSAYGAGCRQIIAVCEKDKEDEYKNLPGVIGTMQTFEQIGRLDERMQDMSMEQAMGNEKLYRGIDRLVAYGLAKGLIQPEDKTFMINRYLELFGVDEYEEAADEMWMDSADSQNAKDVYNIEEILNQLMDEALRLGVLQSDDITSKDLFDTKLMGIMVPNPSQVIQTFRTLYAQDPKTATDYFYKFSQDTDYIRTYRVIKDQKWTVESPYGTIDITINLSKPEKDPKAIAAAKNAKQSAYPKCQLCMENEGYAGRMNHPARQNHRIIPIDINDSKWGFQYSPYVYYNEHCIVFNGEHTPMKIERNTFVKLFDFVKQFPHYFLGSNADLPIVGGSILSHDHFQGGCYTFAMEKAPMVHEFTIPGFEDVKAGIVKWPLSVIRISHENPDRLVELADYILGCWRGYTDEAACIYAETDGEPHNTITPIARKRDGLFELDLALRNNLTTEEYPLGMYHPHAEYHHIKKENIGLIEVMGLAVLPARLKKEMELLADCLVKGMTTDEMTAQHEELEKHMDWAQKLMNRYEDIHADNVMDILREEIGQVFVKVLENAGVYKQDEEGQEAFLRFIASL